MAMMTTASSGLTPQYQRYFDRQLLSYAEPQIVTAQFAQKRPFPKNRGATQMRFFRPTAPQSSVVTSGTGIQDLTAGGEGVPIAVYRELTYTAVDVTMNQYGEAVKITDIVSYTDLFSTLEQSTRVMGEDAGCHADFKVVQQLCNTSTGVNSANRRYGSLAASYAAAGKLVIKDLLGAFTKLTLQKARKPEGAAYATIITPQQGFDVMDDPKFIDSGTRGTTKGLFNGEIGTWYGNRILVTTEGFISSVEGTYNSGGDHFAAMVLGREAVGAPIMAGQSPFSPSIIVNNQADSGNPLKQFLTAGWKAYWATVMLNDVWAVTINSTTTFA